MSKFKDFFYGVGPRVDVNEAFPPLMMEPAHPALISSTQDIMAAAVASRLLQVLSKRGATRLKPSDTATFVKVAYDSLPEGAAAQCDDEVLRILRWLESPPLDEEAPEPPELAVMHSADVSARVATLKFAKAEGLDIELQYFDLERRTWPRMFASVVRIDESREMPYVVLDIDGATAEVDCDQIRWVMPVSARNRPRKKPPADVLTFPTQE